MFPDASESLTAPFATSPSSHSIGPIFNQLKDEISNLLRNENTSLAKIIELEGHLNAYKTALHAKDTKLLEAQNQIKLCEGYRIAAFIDGDGAIFSSEFIKRGKEGGREAARLLSEHILKYVTTNYGANQYQLSVCLFLNKNGLADILGRTANTVVKPKLEEFLMGFNQAAERFLVVDVGDAKEAADAKIKTHLEDAIRLPQTCKIIFGGCHDNGYAASLRSHMTAGFKEKLILLRSYADMAAGIAELDLPALTIPELFSSQKLPTIPRAATNAWNGPPGLGPNSSSPVANLASNSPPLGYSALERSPSSPPKTPATYSATLQDGRRRVSAPDLDSNGSSAGEDDASGRRRSASIRHLTPGVPLSKQNPAPCTIHYLSKSCKFGATCKYAHDYDLNEEHIAVMKQNAKKSPCPAINRNEYCTWEDSCCFGHQCAFLPNCPYYKIGTCKFKGADMHKGPGKCDERW